MDDYQKYIHKSRYARWIEDESRREEWEETVARYIAFMAKHYPDMEEWLNTVAHPAICNMDVMPSMRALMTAGKAAERDHVALYNCAFTAVDTVRAFDEAMYILMCGTGVGFSVEEQFVNKLPVIADSFHESDTVIVVPDSKVGWAKSFRELVSMLVNGQIPKWDTSRVRPAGARLKTFGGRASGPRPLEELFEFTVNVFKNAAGRKLTTIECYDIMCKVADIVVVGGVRRSAMISLSSLGDDKMRHAKDGMFWERNPQRALANNSAVYETKPDIGTFMREWVALYESKSGERGIFNREAANKWAERVGRDEAAFGTNPCVTADTRILTREGYVRIEDVIGEQVEVWNGKKWSEVTPFHTGKNEIIEVHLSNGVIIECTPYHEFVIDGLANKEAKDLKPGDKLAKFDTPIVNGYEKSPVDAYSQGFYSGDGTAGKTYSWIYEPKHACMPRLVGTFSTPDEDGRVTWKHGPMLDKNYVPINAPVMDKLNWLAGLIDADGCVTENPNSQGVQISSIDKEFLLDVRLLLTTLGCDAKVTIMKPAGTYELPNGYGGYSEYDCKDCWRLTINASDVYKLYQLGLRCSRVQLTGGKPNRDARRFVTVVDVVWTNRVEDTYCFTEPQLHQGTFEGVVTGQCGEILLRDGEFCNLTEVVIRPDDTFDTLKHKVEVATALGTLQAGFTDFRYLSAKWKRNCEEERLLGVSLTGIMDHPVMANRSMFPGQEPEEPCVLEHVLDSLREHARKVNEETAAKIGINAAKAITTVKPSGTVSQLVNSASGIHPRYSKYYVRAVRADNKDPLTVFLKEQGVPHEPALGKEDSTTVFYFPIESPDGAVFRDDMTAIEQLELWAIYKQHWTEHNPSITVYVREDEWLEVGAWVYEHFDIVGGLSFLPYDGGVYPQAPYTEITKEKYEELCSQFPNIEWDKFVETEDATDNVKELSCTAGVCEL